MTFMLKTYLFFIILLLPFSVNGQTFTEHLKQQRSGQGKIVVVQDSILERIVNNKSTSIPVIRTHLVKQEQTPQKKSEATPKKVDSVPGKRDDVSTSAEGKNTKKATESRARTIQEAHLKVEKQKTSREQAVENVSYMARVRYKAEGFRIQVYTGGNSRADKGKAQQLQQRCRQEFPELSAYVHFVSPHWVCRVGDFKDREEAQRYANQIRRKRLSYEARIVKSSVLLAR